MQSSQDLNNSAVITTQESADIDSIAHQSCSRKRSHSEMTDDIDENEVTYDILQCFPTNMLYKHVFQHLDGKEMLEMSTVNRQWNKVVGETAQMKKLKLVIDEWNGQLTLKAKGVLMNSDRKYQNIEIRIESEEYAEFALSILAKGTGRWKDVSIKILAQMFQNIWPKILKIIEPTVEDLFIRDHAIKETTTAVPVWTFPRLKCLTCHIRSYNAFKYFIGATSLITFNFFVPNVEIHAATVDMETVLRNNHNLKTIRTEADDLQFFQNWSKTKFKLQNFKFYFDEEEWESPEPFLTFLKTQASTLESLKLITDVDQTLLELILRMPRLTFLSIREKFAEIRDLPVNSRIENFELHFFGHEDDEIRDEDRVTYRRLIRAMPSVKHLKWFRIDAELFLLLAHYLPGLESLEVDYFNVLCIPDQNVFPNIREFQVYRFHESMLEPTADHNFAKLVRREMRKANGGLPQM